MTNVPKVYIGVDISKNHLDMHVYPLGKHLKIKNSEEEIQVFIKGLAQYDVAAVGCEATGGYEKLLARALQGKEYQLWIIDPRRIKGFIIASGGRSKTDKIDAQKIAEFVAKTPQEYKTVSKTQIEENLQALVNRKNDLIKFLGAEKTRLQHPSHASHASSIKRFIKMLEKEIARLDQEIAGVIQSDKDLNQKSKILESIPGIGKASAAGLLSFVPELGTISNSKIAALVGLCPYDNSSGSYQGKKFIKGGRATPRTMLYMCALTTIRHNLVLKHFYDRLREKQKPFKVAIVAVMRKMIILANSLLKKGELCRV